MYRKMSLLLAAPALLLANTSQAAVSATPPSPDGDMGCFVALQMVVVMTSKAANDTARPADKRQEAREFGEQFRPHAEFFFGRISAQSPNLLDKSVYNGAFDRFMKLSNDDQFKTIEACSKWAMDRRLEILDPWTGK